METSQYFRFEWLKLSVISNFNSNLFFIKSKSFLNKKAAFNEKAHDGTRTRGPHPYQGCALPTELHGQIKERAMRFELTTATLEGWSSTIELCPPLLWAGVVSNHRRPKPMDLQSIPFSHSGTYPFSGADGGTQTPDRSITSRMLYQLSYIGSKFCRKKSFKYN
jgi:hypothetical protein